jgi:hypothetical protein
MIKADYNSIIYDYLAIESDIASIDAKYSFSPAMEADVPTGGTTAAATTVPTQGARAQLTGTNDNGQKAAEINAKNAVKSAVKDNLTDKNPAEKLSKFQKALSAVKEFLKKIADILDNVKRWIQNRIRSLVNNDRSFNNQYQQRKRLVKPLDEVTVVNYAYTNNNLERPIKGLMQDIESCLRTLSMTTGGGPTGRVSDIINAPQGEMLKVLFKPYTQGAETEVSSAPNMTKYLVANYRTDKRERTYRQTDIPAIERNAMNTSEISNRCNSYINTCTQLYGSIRNLEKELRPDADEKQISTIRENARKAAVLYNTYNSIIHSYFELRLEASMNYRIILKKFYQM